MILQGVFSGLTDFLFPKPLSVISLENLTASEILRLLPSAKDLGEDTLAIWNYATPETRELIWELKYRKNEKILENLALILYDVIKTEVSERALYDNFSHPLLIPMPMSSERRRERGFNQTEILCEAIKKFDTENTLEYDPNILQKSHHTESQTLVENKKLRLQNLENSMQAKNVEGRNIILIDDVTTTGATFKEARRALKHAAAKKILCLALAH